MGTFLTSQLYLDKTSQRNPHGFNVAALCYMLRTFGVAPFTVILFLSSGLPLRGCDSCSQVVKFNRLHGILRSVYTHVCHMPVTATRKLLHIFFCMN